MECVAIDLFCGIGGLTHGVEKAGIKVAAGFDLDASCRYAYEHNNNSQFINKGIEDISSDELKSLYSSGYIKILMGCAPCQPFSNYSHRYAKAGRKDDKWKLLYYFIDHVDSIRPHIVSIENVPQLVKEKVFIDFIEKLKSFGYYVSWKIVNCADYGVPQMRNRLVLLASLLAPIEMVEPRLIENEYVTVWDAIGELPPLSNGGVSESDILHKCSKLSAKNEERIKQSTPGGTWRDWDDSLKSPCHNKNTGKGYTTIYGRMDPNKPSPTITTEFYNYGSGRFGHPYQDRAISLREGALLQSFPIHYDFVDKNEPLSTKQIGVHIGNAVPVKLGMAIGKSIISHIEGRLSQSNMVSANNIAPELKSVAGEQIRNLQKEISYDTKDYPIEVLVEKFRADDFYIPDYQRQFIWDDATKVRFIESVLLGLPIPFMFFSDNEDGRSEIIDGAQRTQTLEEFLYNDLRLTGLEKLTSLNGFRFSDMPDVFQRKFKGRTLRIINLSDTTSLEIRQDIFNRINTGGRKALPSEIRRGSHTGPFMIFVKKCADNELFNRLCPMSDIMKKRYEDSELVVRFFAYLHDYKRFTHDVEKFLNRFVVSCESIFSESRFENEFLSMLMFVDKYFPFGFAKTANAKSVPKVRFEAISVGVALALKTTPELSPTSMEWLLSEDFKVHTTTHASNSQKRVTGRIEYVRDALLEGD